MAIIYCVSCGETYSDSLSTCPHCGFMPKLFKCPECGGIYGYENNICPSCGFLLSQARIPATMEEVERGLQMIRVKLATAKSEVQLNQVKKNLNVYSIEYDVQSELQECQNRIVACVESARKESILEKASSINETDADVLTLEEIIQDLHTINNDEKATELLMQFEARLSASSYKRGLLAMESAKTIDDWKNAQVLFENSQGQENAQALAEECQKKVAQLSFSKKKKLKAILFSSLGVIVVAVAIVFLFTYFLPNYHYQQGKVHFDNCEYSIAMEEFLAAGNYQDAVAQAETSRLAQLYSDGQSAFQQEDYANAIDFFTNAGEYRDAIQMLAYSKLGLHYANGKTAYENDSFEEAIVEFTMAESFSDAPQRILESKYALADQLLSNEEYLQAAEFFAELSDYNDSKDREFAAAKMLLSAGNYTDAETAFSLIDDSNFSAYASYARGKQELDAKLYEDAVLSFKTASGVEDADELLMTAAFEYGKALISSKEYQSAKAYFNMAKNHPDSTEMIYACDFLLAEENFTKGYLNTAKSQYEKLPADFTYNGISVSERLTTLAKNKSFVDMCGKWKATGECIIETMETSRYGSWDAWWTTYTSPSQYLTITCIINKDGTVTVKGSAEMWRYTNYSSLSAYLNRSEATVNFNKALSYTPNNTEMSSNFRLTYNSYSSAFSAIYKIVDSTSSVYFNYTYTSTYTYGTRVTTY